MTGEQRLALDLLYEGFVEETGRLTRRVEPHSSLGHLADRLCGLCETFHGILSPTAAEIAAVTTGAAHLGWEGGGANGYDGPPTLPDDDAAIDAALELVDARWRRLQERLGRAA